MHFQPLKTQARISCIIWLVMYFCSGFLHTLYAQGDPRIRPIILAPDSVSNIGFVMRARVTPMNTNASLSNPDSYWKRICISYEIAIDSNFQIIIQSIRPTSGIICACRQDMSDVCTLVCNSQFLPSVDSVVDFRFPVSELQPGMMHYYRVRAWGYISDYSTISIFSTIASIRLPTASPPSIPTLALARNIGATEFTAYWNIAQGRPTNYTIDVASDINFTQILPAFNNASVRDTQLRITGLQPNTRYFYRVRAMNQLGTTAYSTIGQEQTLSMLPFQAQRVSSSQLPSNCCGFFPNRIWYVTSIPNPNWLSAQRIDSLLRVFVQANIPVDTIYAQGTDASCPTVNLMLSLRRDAPTQMQQLGFTRQRLTSNWITGCPCPSAIIYAATTILNVAQNQNEPWGLSVYPNSVEHETTVTYSLPSSALCRMEVYDVLGQVKAKITDETHIAGTHTLRLGTDYLSAGTYFIRLTARSTSGETLYKTVQFHVVR